MANLIDKDALVAEIDKRINAWKEYYDDMRNAECYTLASGAYLRIDELENLKKFLNTLEVKEVNLEKDNVTSDMIDDTDISCDCTSCDVHINCKYFNPEKESNVKHCFGGVPMQLKTKK